MNCLRGTCPSLLNAIVSNLSVWVKISYINALVDDREWFFSMTTPDHTHTANMTKAAIQELEWEILPHPPYSPDLAPSDFHLFRSLSNNLCGVSFNNQAVLQNWLDEFFTAKPEDFFKREMENLPESWKAVVSNGGEYTIH
jgi:hypothetical protein